MRHTTHEGAARAVALGLTALVLSLATAGSAIAQARSSANSGPVTLIGHLDLPSVYVFRGFVQESSPAVTVSPSADAHVALGATTLHLGTWHSLQTGSSGLDGPTGRLHYEERFSAGLLVPIGSGFSLDTTYTAYTYPGNLLGVRQEIGVRVEKRDRWNPHVLVAVELQGAADGTDDGSGTYFEVGGAPAFELGAWRATVTVPLIVGLSLKDYYQGFAGDSRFGFFSGGALLTIPLGRGGPKGHWAVRGGADLYLLGDTPEAFNQGERRTVVARVGLTFRY